MRYSYNLTRVVLLGVLYMLHLTRVWAQGEQKLTIVGPTVAGKELFFVSEVHSIEERWSFYESLIRHLVQNNGITNIVKEAGNADAYLYNEYLRNGDTTIFRQYDDRKFRHFMEVLKELDKQQPESKKIRMYGMDFERMEFVAATRKILSENEMATGTGLFKYVFAIPDSLCFLSRMTKEQSEFRRRAYGDARDIFEKEKNALKQKVKKDYETLALIFENPTLETKFSRRDIGMYKNIKKQLKDQPFLCILGRYHTEYRRHQVYPSLIKLMTRGHKTNSARLVLIDEVRNGRFRIQKLMVHEGTPMEYSYGKAGPDYFTKNDSAMSVAYGNYVKLDCFTIVHKSIFKDLVHKDNHGLDSYYIFFGEWPPKK